MHPKNHPQTPKKPGSPTLEHFRFQNAFGNNFGITNHFEPFVNIPLFFDICHHEEVHPQPHLRRGQPQPDFAVHALVEHQRFFGLLNQVALSLGERKRNVLDHRGDHLIGPVAVDFQQSSPSVCYPSHLFFNRINR